MRSIFTKRVWISLNVFVVKNSQIWDEMGPGLRWWAQIWFIWIENDLIKLFKTLLGPGEAIFDQK